MMQLNIQTCKNKDLFWKVFHLLDRINDGKDDEDIKKELSILVKRIDRNREASR